MSGVHMGKFIIDDNNLVALFLKVDKIASWLRMHRSCGIL
jgi:hypothetical protein